MIRWPLLAALSLSATGPALAEANTLKALGGELKACLAGMRLSPGAAATVRFSLKRDGSLNGEPRLTYARFPADPAARAADAAELARAFDRCLPLSLTDGLGAAIAGRPFTIHIGPRRPGSI